WSTSGPRAVFTNTAVGFISLNCAAPISLWFSGVRAAWTETKSLSRNSSSSPTRRAPSSASACGFGARSWYSTRMSQPRWHRRASAAGGGGRHVDVVEPDGVVAHHLQPRGGVEHLAVDA